jgi:hypothetical protein
MSKDPHVHNYIKSKTQDVILHKYVNDKDVATTGKDTIRMWVCECGAYIAYDLERVLA